MACQFQCQACPESALATSSMCLSQHVVCIVAPGAYFTQPVFRNLRVCSPWKVGNSGLSEVRKSHSRHRRNSSSFHKERQLQLQQSLLTCPGQQQDAPKKPRVSHGLLPAVRCLLQSVPHIKCAVAEHRPESEYKLRPWRGLMGTILSTLRGAAYSSWKHSEITTGLQIKSINFIEQYLFIPRSMTHKININPESVRDCKTRLKSRLSKAWNVFLGFNFLSFPKDLTQIETEFMFSTIPVVFPMSSLCVLLPNQCFPPKTSSSNPMVWEHERVPVG